jgi:hypothetical protein
MNTIRSLENLINPVRHQVQINRKHKNSENDLEDILSAGYSVSKFHQSWAKIAEKVKKLENYQSYSVLLY